VPRYVLKRLPLWGRNDGNPVDFEYPSNKEFESWSNQKDTKVIGIKICEKARAYGIASV